MAGSKIEKFVMQLALPEAEKLGFELVDVEFVKEGANWFLRIYIDKPDGIMIDDCELMNNAVEPLLDEADPISQAYYLEVCSPGLDRPLKTDRDFEKYKGELVEINLYKALNGEKHFEGRLIGRENGVVTILEETFNRSGKKTGETQLEFPVESISIIRRMIEV